jgi:hypothetical protein
LEPLNDLIDLTNTNKIKAVTKSPLQDSSSYNTKSDTELVKSKSLKQGKHFYCNLITISTN